MALGSIGITQFKPQRSQTAAELLTTAPQADSKKEERLELRIRSDVLITFKEICKAGGTNVSKALRAYIEAIVSNGTL